MVVPTAPGLQCAALSTMVEVMMEPPQYGDRDPVLFSPTCHGYSFWNIAGIRCEIFAMVCWELYWILTST